MMILIGLIIVLVLLLVLVGIVYYAYRNISKKVRGFSQMAFGTQDIMKGFKQVEHDYAVTPKSVSAATSLHLPRITKDFPDFHYEEMKRRAQNVLLSYLQSIDEDRISCLTEGTEELKDKLQMQLTMLRGDGIRAHYDSPKLHRMEISQYRKEKSRCSVVFQASVEYYYYEEKGGAVTVGSRDTKKQSRYNVECIYIQDRDLIENVHDAGLGMVCPRCGGVLPGVGAKVCQFCDTPIIEFNIRAWHFSDVKEV